MFADVLTSVHSLLSFAAIILGFAALPATLRHDRPDPIALLFLATAVLVTATGFLFPFQAVTPAFATGLLSSVALVAMLAALFRYQLAGGWRRVYDVGVVVSLYLLVFVLIAQLFLKVPALRALAPTGTEPPFAVAQGICLLAFLYIGWKVVRGPRLRPSI